MTTNVFLLTFSADNVVMNESKLKSLNLRRIIFIFFDFTC